jgi:hypothetical protein
MVLGVLRSSYKDRDACTTVGKMGGFSLSDSHFLRQGNRVINFFGEDILSHKDLNPNRMLIVFVPMNQVYTHTI